jgi:hypothetical protein
MKDGIELIYSQQDSGFVKDRAYSNPRFYTTPRQGVSKVYLVGDWPKIEADYKALGVPVERLDVAPKAEPPATAKPTSEAVPVDDRGSVYIPEDWRELKYTGPADAGLTLRALAALVSDTPVKNKAEAVAAIEAELKRRELDTPVESAGGLTRREINADLEAAGIEPDPNMTDEEAAAARAEAAGE